MTDCVLTAERNGVLVITLNRPQARNAAEFHGQLTAG